MLTSVTVTLSISLLGFSGYILFLISNNNHEPNLDSLNKSLKNKMEATSDHGWGRYGPTNRVLANIILNSPIKHLVQPTNVAQAAAAAGAVAQCGGIEYEEEDNGKL